jgi:hypothetical protein
MAARERRIPYLGITHGIYFADSFNIVIPNGNSVGKIERYGRYFKILRFYLSVLKLKDAKLASDMLRFLYYFMRIGYFAALDRVKFEQRWPLRYLVYQLKNSGDIMYNKHGFPADKLVPIGVPQFDQMFRIWNRFHNQSEEKSPYFLMIDTAWIFNATKPPEEFIYGTYTRLAAFCQQQGCKLVVKLHPHWYEHELLPKHDNILYVRNLSQTELANLIIHAKGCFLYFSTLSIPIVPYKNCYFLYYKTFSKDLQDITALGVAKSLDVAAIDEANINFSEGFNQQNMDQYIADYLYSVDGRSTERLGDVLSSWCRQEQPSEQV